MAKDIQLHRQLVNFGQVQARYTRILLEPIVPTIQGLLMTLAPDEFQEDYQYYFNHISDEKWYMAATDVGGHVLLIKDSDRSLWAFGGNTYGELGLGDTVTRSTITLVDSTQAWSFVAAGRDMSFAIAGGKLYAAGRNTDYQLGLGYTSAYESTFQRVGTRTDWAKVEAGRYHAIATTTGKRLFVWGINSLGQLGIGGILTKQTPYDTTRYAEEITAQEHTSAYIDASGALYFAGYNNFRVAGFVSSYPYRVTPFTRIANNGEVWTKASLGEFHILALNDNHKLWGWGTNYFGQLAPFPTTGSTAYVAPMQLSSKNWEKISAGYEHTTLLDTDGYVYSSGRGAIIGGQLGLGHINQINAITKVEQSVNEDGQYATLDNVSDIVAGYRNTIAIKGVVD